MGIAGPRDYNGGNIIVIGRIDEAHPAVVYALLAILMAAVFVPMSFFRLVDGDEGTYLLVSRLVIEGQLPYHDFHYPQMFLLPYVYGAWMKLAGYSWYGARLLSGFFAIALGLLLYRQVARLAGARAWGVLAAVIFTFTSLAFGYYPLVKDFVLPTLLLFGAYTILSTRSRWKWLASGLLVGLSVACRLYVIGVVPAFLIEIYLNEKELKPRLMQAAQFAVGLVLTLLPTEFFLLLDPKTFVFNVVGSFTIRSDYSVFGWWEQKVEAPRILMALGFAEGVMSLQFILLFLVSVTSWISCALSRERLPLASSIAILLSLASFAPTPTYTQYFCMPLPFLLVGAVVFGAALTRESTAPRLRHLLATLAVVYLLVSPLDLYRYTISGEMLPGLYRTPDRVTDWRLTTIRAVGRAIDREVRPERPLVISFWPGYFVETRATIMPGMENHFALMFSERVTAREAIQFKLMSYPMLIWHIERHTVDVVVLGNWIDWTAHIGEIRNQILKSGYVLKERIAQAELYTLPRQAARQ